MGQILQSSSSSTLGAAAVARIGSRTSSSSSSRIVVVGWGEGQAQSIAENRVGDEEDRSSSARSPRASSEPFTYSIACSWHHRIR
jgi:hypothetical protein